MFGLGGNDEDEQRLWNMVMFKIPMSDKEFEESAPILFIITGVIIIIGIIAYLLN